MEKRPLLHVEAGNMIENAINEEAAVAGKASISWNTSFATVTTLCKLLEKGHVPKKERPAFVKRLWKIVAKAITLPNLHLCYVIAKAADSIANDKSD